MTAVAYIRRSSRASKAGDGEVSLAAQESAVRELAHRDGHNGELMIFTDAGRSGDEAKIGKRSEYARMLAMIERGEVTDVYAYALDRLHRSVIGTTKLVKAVEAHGVRIVTQREGEVRNDSADEWLRWTILSTFGEYELRISKARAQSRDDTRRARGDYLGVVPYGYQRVDGKLDPNPAEDVAVIMEAYQAAGSFLGAAQRLTRAGVRPRSGEHWSDQTVARILRREGLVSEGGNGRRLTRVDHYLAGILRCVCGGPMTGMQKNRRPEWTVYICQRARRDPHHTRPYAIAERKILDWIKVEAARLRVPEAVELAAPDARRDELEEDRRRAGIAYNARAMSDDEFSTIIKCIDDDLARLEAAEQIVDVPQAIDWEGWDRGAVNAVLRALFEYVELDVDMKPVRAEWRLPSEYVA